MKSFMILRFATQVLSRHLPHSHNARPGAERRGDETSLASARGPSVRKRQLGSEHIDLDDVTDALKTAKYSRTRRQQQNGRLFVGK
jgi:hypothetical protein